jgi:preprotein translocase SecF subunit
MRFDFIKHRVVFYTIALVLFVASLAAPLVFPVNLGIDMTGGTQTEYNYSGTFDKAQVEKQVAQATQTAQHNGKSAINTTVVYAISGEKKFVVEAGFNTAGISDADLDAIKTKFRDTLTSSLAPQGMNLVKYNNVGESFGDYIKKTAYLTLVLVIVVISLYIAYAFRGTIEGISSTSFGFVTAISLFHDVVIAFGLYVLTSHFFPEFKVDTFFITAMLTVLGYSINDTIVVMDRIRSNLRLPGSRKANFGALINDSVNDTMTRSVFTSLTVVIVLVAMFFFGPQAIQGFALALIFGTLVGAYSSICIAAPLLYDITRNK